MFSQKTLIIIAHFILLSTVACQTIRTPQTLSRNILPEQWKYFLRFALNNTGLGVRITSSGVALQSTGFTFTYTTPSTRAEEIRLTVRYDNASWTSDGTTTVKLTYKNTKPLPKFGRNVNLDGTLSDLPPGAIIAFYPRGFGFFTTKSLFNLPLYAVEKFIIHPFDQRVRLSVIPIYIQGSFLRFSYFREEAEIAKFGNGFFSTSINGKPIEGDVTGLNGLWTKIERCLEPSYRYNRTISVERNPSWAFPTGNQDVVAVELPDNVYMSVPKSVGTERLGKITTLSLQWRINFRTVVRSDTVYDRSGNLQSDCSSIYYRVV